MSDGEQFLHRLYNRGRYKIQRISTAMTHMVHDGLGGRVAEPACYLNRARSASEGMGSDSQPIP